MPHKKIYRDFLKHAEDLLPSGSGRPESVALRRCISTSYYAVWHCLCYSWSSKFNASLQDMIYRQPNHGRAKTAAIQMRSQKNTWAKKSCCDEISVMCGDFITLQSMRHEADYDIGRSFKKREAEEALYRAKRCIELFDESLAAPKDSDISAQLDCFLLESLNLKHQDRK